MPKKDLIYTYRYAQNVDKCHQGFKQDKTGMDISFYQQMI